MRVQDSSRAGHPRDREMDRSFRRRPAAAANNPRGFVHFEDLLGRQAGLVQARGRDGQAKRLPPDHHAEVSACAERPSARIKASSNFGQGSGELGETRAAGIFGTRRRLFLARKGPGLLPFHNRGLSHAPMRPRNVRSGKPSGGRHGGNSWSPNIGLMARISLFGRAGTLANRGTGRRVVEIWEKERKPSWIAANSSEPRERCSQGPAWTTRLYENLSTPSPLRKTAEVAWCCQSIRTGDSASAWWKDSSRRNSTIRNSRASPSRTPTNACRGIASTKNPTSLFPPTGARSNYRRKREIAMSLRILRA